MAFTLPKPCFRGLSDSLNNAETANEDCEPIHLVQDFRVAQGNKTCYETSLQLLL